MNDLPKMKELLMKEATYDKGSCLRMKELELKIVQFAIKGIA
jgi:hypothetical protein